MPESRHIEFVAIGASAGGVGAIRKIMLQLQPNFDAPIGIVQHLPARARIDVQLVYGVPNGRRVVEVEDKMKIEAGRVYLATPGYHMLVEKNQKFALTLDEPVHHSRPSIDVFFESVARAYRGGAVGILLTGANYDGADGLAVIKEVGGTTIVQDPSEADSPTMPEAAIRRRTPDYVLNLDQIGQWFQSAILKEGAMP